MPNLFPICKTPFAKKAFHIFRAKKVVMQKCLWNNLPFHKNMKIWKSRLTYEDAHHLPAAERVEETNRERDEADGDQDVADVVLKQGVKPIAFQTLNLVFSVHFFLHLKLFVIIKLSKKMKACRMPQSNLFFQWIEFIH